MIYGQDSYPEVSYIWTVHTNAVVGFEWQNVSSLLVLFKFIKQPIYTQQIRVIPSVKLS